jgi:2,3-bisphosphoglycerate-independent phosphoglycerate mutase
MKKPLVLCIMDGIGINNNQKGNAYVQANTPILDSLFDKYPSSLLTASGELVGLPEGIMGNSEVGHQNIGAGRIVYQHLQMINEKIKNEEFFQNENLLEIMNYVKEKDSKLHLLGLVSDAGVHSRLNHLFAIIDMCKINNVKELYIHLFTDGRDTPVDSSIGFIKQIDDKLKEAEIGTIATISGRFYSMDRDNRYERVEKAYDVLTGLSDTNYQDYESAIKENYANEKTDEFIIPGVIDANGIIEENDGVLYFNYRPDRIRELGSALSNPNFDGFNRKKIVNVKLTTLMPVSDEVLYKSAYELQILTNTLGEYISSLGLSQLRIAETEKYAHVTYFFDGGEEKELLNCKRILIPSPKVETYDLQPEMSAHEITENLLNELPNTDVVILNYANGDMLGHTGNLNAAIEGVEVVDECIGKIYNKIKELDGTLIITADHGNCEYMLDDNNNLVTSHTTNLVPFLITEDIEIKDGKLGDIAPTMLKLLDVEIPKEMTGEPLV